MAYQIPKLFLDHLAGQFELVKPVLFTGAGFSRAARNFDKTNLPSVEELKILLWGICFPGEAYDSNSTLAHLYGTAANRHAKQLTEAFTRALTVNPDLLPDWYKLVFSFPWAKCYTLNIDDLAVAVARKFDLPRAPKMVSALELAAPHGDEIYALRTRK